MTTYGVWVNKSNFWAKEDGKVLRFSSQDDARKFIESKGLVNETSVSFRNSAYVAYCSPEWDQWNVKSATI
jgi:hypothetical protein